MTSRITSAMTSATTSAARERRDSHRDLVDQLNVALLVGGLVLLVAVLAVRLSDRSGLPTLLLYLGLGLAVGEAGLGAAVRRPRADPGARLRRARRDPGRGRPDHELVRDPAGRRAGRRPVHPRGRGVGRGGRDRGVPRCCTSSWSVALLVGAVLTSTDAAAVFSVLRRVPLPAAADRRAGGGVRLQRRARGDPGRRAVRPGGASRLGPRLVGPRADRRGPSWPAGRPSVPRSAGSVGTACGGCRCRPRRCSRSP